MFFRIFSFFLLFDKAPDRWELIPNRRNIFQSLHQQNEEPFGSNPFFQTSICNQNENGSGVQKEIFLDQTQNQIEKIDDLLFISHLSATNSSYLTKQIDPRKYLSPSFHIVVSDMELPFLSMSCPSPIMELSPENTSESTPPVANKPNTMVLSKDTFELFISINIYQILEVLVFDNVFTFPVETFHTKAANNYLNLKRKIQLQQQDLVSHDRKSNEFKITSKVGKGAYAQTVLATEMKYNGKAGSNMTEFIFKIDKDKYSVQWEAYIHALVSSLYTFEVSGLSLSNV